MIMFVLMDNNISIKEYYKISKYKDLEIEIKKMWWLKTITVPVVVGAPGMIQKGADKRIKKIPGSSSLYEIQKIALCRTALLRRWAVLQRAIFCIYY